MRTAFISILALTLFATGCKTTTHASFDADARASLFSAMTALEGKWESDGGDGNKGTSIFEVSSGGSVIREFMAVGTPYEMTNMYTLDGNDLVMTHYCSIGNQPRMRATGIEDGRIAFKLEKVGDMKSPGDMYMGELTLVLHDADRIEQQWTSFQAGKDDQHMNIMMNRVK